MIECPNVSLLWDTRTGQLRDHGESILVTASGEATLSSGAAAEVAKAAFLESNPNMHDFVADPSIVMFTISVAEFGITQGYGRTSLWSPTLGAEAEGHTGRPAGRSPLCSRVGLVHWYEQSGARALVWAWSQ